MRALYLSFFTVCFILLPAGAGRLPCAPSMRWEVPTVPVVEKIDAESQLAAGGRISFRSAGIYELELLSGVSDRLAGNLLAKKGQILAQSGRGSQSLELAHGVGPGTAQKLGEFLDLE